MRPIVRYRGHGSVCSASYVPPTSSVAHLRHTQPWTHSEIDQQACWKGDRVSRTGDRVGDMVLSIVVLGWTCVAALAPCSERALKRVHINVLQQHHGRLQAVAVYLLGLCCDAIHKTRGACKNVKKSQRKEAAALLSGSSSVLEHRRTTSGAVRRDIKLQKFCRLIAHRCR